MATKSLDTLHRIGAKVTNVAKEFYSSHADSEDLKMLYQMLNLNILSLSMENIVISICIRILLLNLVILRLILLF